MKLDDLDDVHPDVEQRHVDAAVEIAVAHSPADPESQPDVIAELAEIEAGVPAVMRANFPERPQ